MASTFKFIFRKTQWGIIIWITAEIEPLSQYIGFPKKVAKNIWLAVEAKYEGKPRNLLEEELHYVTLGLKLVEDQINEKSKDQNIVIRIVDFLYADTDFQYEGWACGIAGWAAQELGFTFEQPEIYFNKDKNKYIFNFPPVKID